MMGIHLWILTINNREFMVVSLIRFAKLECQFHVWVDGRDIKLATRGQHQPRNITGGMIYIPFEYISTIHVYIYIYIYLPGGKLT